MDLPQIQAREAELQALPMGTERWQGTFELIDAKARCPDYKHNSQPFAFAEWLNRLAEASKKIGIMDEDARAAYYEGQPATWVDWYDDGYTAHDAAIEDMQSWE